MPDLDLDMMELVRKHLPEQMCNILKKELEELEELRNAKAVDEEVLEELDRLRERAKTQEELEQQELKLLEDRATLEQTKAEFDRDKKVFELEQQLKAQSAVNAHLRDIQLGLVRNVEYRKTLSGARQIPVPGGDGCCGHTESHVLNETTTETAE